MLLTLQVYREDVRSERLQGHQEAIAAAVQAEASNAPRPGEEWVALMLTVASNETHFSLRIFDGACKPQECDHGRAKGLWQIHSNTLNRDAWAKQDGDIALQAHLASDALKRAYWTCSRSGVPWLQGTLNAFAGRRCGDTWPGLGVRLATYQRLTHG